MFFNEIDDAPASIALPIVTFCDIALPSAWMGVKKKLE
jgi:hypothetical protein